MPIATVMVCVQLPISDW